MWNQYTKTMRMSVLKSKMSDDFDSDVRDLSWNSVLALFSSHDVRREKDGETFMPVLMKDKQDRVSNKKENEQGEITQTYRIDANVDSITMAVFDLDEEGALEDAEKVFSDFDYVVYSTHSYSAEHKYKSRIVVRLEESIKSADWNSFVYNLSYCMDLDLNCKNVSRNFYLPSISSEVKIAPLFKANAGKGITITDSVILKEKFKKNRTPERQRTFDNAFANISKNYVQNNDIFQKINKKSVNSTSKSSFDFQDMALDFKSNISSLRQNDSRHAFARDVIYRTIMINGKDIDWYNLVQFLHKVTLTIGSKQFHHGNTPSELKSLIRNVIMKGVGSEGNSESDYEYLKETNRTIDQANVAAAESMRTGVWYFNESALKNEIKSGAKLKDKDYNEETILGRNKSTHFALRKDDDVIGYIMDIYKSEIERFGFDVDINSVGQYAFYHAKKHLIKIGENISDYKSELFDSLKFSELSGNLNFTDDQVEKMTRYFATSVKLGYLAANNEKKFDLVKKSTSESSLTI